MLSLYLRFVGIQNALPAFLLHLRSGEAAIMAEVFARGPVACGVDATPLLDYAGGIINDTTDQSTDHIVSITGWGYDSATSTKYWIVRNSWGEAWGENGAAF